MIEYIEIGGAKRPIRFGFAGLYEYEVETGRKALSDFAQMQGGLENTSIIVLVDFVSAGLRAGYKAAGIGVDFEKYDVADWIQETGVLEKVMTAFAESFPQAGNGVTGKATKAKPTPVNLPGMA
jgi:hypothetical protein